MTARTTHPATFSTDRSGALSLVTKLTATSTDLAPTIARVALGLVMFPHGAQKALGWFGGAGFGNTMAFMTSKMGIPAPFVLLAIAAEFLGALGLVTGALSRVAAFGIAVTMLVAIVMAHASNGFFMNWMGTQAGEGFEYHLLAIALAVVVMVKGGGRWSVDGKLAGHVG